jgi:hypothetical protein
LVLIVTSWFVHVPFWDSGRSAKSRKISFFQEAPAKKPERSVAGKR